MANTARETAPQSEEKKKAGIEDMLNNRKFLEALSVSEPDAEVTEDNIELQEKYEAFGKAQEISNEIIGIYKDKIFKDIGVKMDKAEFQAVETYINKKVFENPKEIEKFASQVKEYKEAPDRIAQKEREIEGLTGGRDLKEVLNELRERRLELMDAKSNLEINKGNLGTEKERIDRDKQEKEKAMQERNLLKKGWEFFVSSKGDMRKQEIDSLSENLETYAKNIDIIEAELKKINTESEKAGEQIKIIETRNLLKNSADEARENLFSNFEPMEEIATKAREKVAEKFTTLFSEGSAGNLSKANEAQEFLNRMKKVNTEEEWTDYLENIDTDLTQEQLDGVIEKLVSTEFEKSVDNFKIGDRPLEKMEKVLKPLLNKSEIGSKDNEEVKDFMAKTLSDISKNLPQKDLRKFLLNHIIGKLEKGLYDTAI